MFLKIHKTLKVKPPALFISKLVAKLERAARTKLAQNCHNQLEQQQSSIDLHSISVIRIYCIVDEPDFIKTNQLFTFFVLCD